MFIKKKRLTLKPYSDKDRDAIIKLLTNSSIKNIYDSRDERIQIFYLQQ